MNIQVCNDHDLLDMFAKHKASKCCFLTLSYHSPSTEPLEIPPWDFSCYSKSVDTPFTPSMPCPSIPQPSHTQSETEDDEYLANPNPSNEHVGVDEEGLYIDLGPQQPPPPIPQSQGCSTERNGSDAETYCETNSDDESMSDDENYEMEDVDDIVKDNEPDHMPDADYDKKDPPMIVGSVYRDMYAFKMALASHAVKHEFH
uniref:Transposase MuDR plant domain-containing protein n=1 Tax=Setaria viridis TaxID=4556 RepID=A0A4U6TJ22_SETVI|nr:hypothetical protein SEVIR_8G244500v2 [Setaria viridis]